MDSIIPEAFRVQNYSDFTAILLKAGFALGGGNNEGIFSVVPWGWQEEAPYDTPVRWHTEDPETDPWEWRMRVLDECNDIAYAKLFFKKSGYITKECYPYFLSVRRKNRIFEEEYSDGTISNAAKRIYDTIAEHGILPVHGIKALAAFSKEDKGKFDRALVELQMKMYITMCGKKQKLSNKGEEYGWSSTVFCLTENFFGESVFDKAAKISEEEGIEQISKRVYQLNPQAESKKVLKFIRG